MQRSSPLEPSLAALEKQLRLVVARADAIVDAVASVQRALESATDETRQAALVRLANMATRRVHREAEPLVALLAEALPNARDAATPCEALLRAGDRRLVLTGLASAASAARSGHLLRSASLSAAALAALERFKEDPRLDEARDAASTLAAPGGDPARLGEALLDPDPHTRRLAARLLDARGEAAPEPIAEALLGRHAFEKLRPYLAYTRARFEELLDLAPRPGHPPPALEDILAAEATLGRSLLRSVIAELSWSRLARGLEVQPLRALSVDGSLPMPLTPPESQLLETLPGARTEWERTLIYAHGGRTETTGGRAETPETFALFKRYNLDHAAALAEILDVAPLDASRVQRLLTLLDRLVAAYATLFGAHSEECGRLPELYAALRTRITDTLANEGDRALLSPELTRLVLTFEDPERLDRVETLHGLKRYLHQRGLRLAFRLFESERATDRSVDLVLTDATRVLSVHRVLRYVDLDERDTDAQARMPYAVSVVAEGFARQLLYEREALPSVEIFCYGNEVHYYVSFRNHPVFLRIDYSPPQKGGMIDLHYFGVSQYELDHHPDLGLGAIRLFLRQLEFDAHVEELQIHARYDKERALGLDDLCDKAEALFRLVPYLMEIDWVIGSLKLPDEARRTVAAAWAASFARWGVLPLERLLTKDRTGILVGEEPGPAGARELRWDGRGAYRDRFFDVAANDVCGSLLTRLEEDGIDLGTAGETGDGQLAYEALRRRLLAPLRDAAARGEIEASPEGYRPRPAELFRRRHEALLLAALVDGGGAPLRRAARCARLLRGVERTLKTVVTGSVSGALVVRSQLALPGGALGLYTLRDDDGTPRLTLYGPPDGLFERRESASSAWRPAWRDDPAWLAARLRESGYLLGDEERDANDDDPELAELDTFRARLHADDASDAHVSLKEERLLPGLVASPGRAVGPARLGIGQRRPEECEGSLLFTPAMRPEDNAYLYRAAGIVSTGGGVLSHAGLLANQFAKPALIVDARWRRGADGRETLRYTALEFEEESRVAHGCAVVARTRIRRRESEIREGDLVVLDGRRGRLRILGQGVDALALHANLRQLAEAGGEDEGQDPAALLARRGRRLRARHQLEKLLTRLADPVLARFAVRELLIGGAPGARTARPEERSRLLALLWENKAVAPAALARLRELRRALERRWRELTEEARRFIPRSDDPGEVLSMRLASADAAEALRRAQRLLEQSGISVPPCPDAVVAEIDDLAGQRLRALGELFRAEVREFFKCFERPGRVWWVRHRVRQLERLSGILPALPDQADELAGFAAAIRDDDREVQSKATHRFVLEAADGGLELQPLVGWKAANLGEVARLVGPERVPPWFVVTQAAFLATMDARHGRQGSGSRCLRDAIAAVLGRTELEHAQQAEAIRKLWLEVPLPPAFEEALRDAYRSLSKKAGENAAHVAVRSSNLEEDTESRSRAGEFETYLFVRGEESLLEHLRLAWAGFWTERAIHNRAAFGLDPVETGGGILVQRMVNSRSSGVAQTVHPAGRRHLEIIVGAGLGLGEGIVSGTVPADQYVVAKDSVRGSGPVEVRIATADKRERIVFDTRAGQGTRREEVPYHQRLRPALEYVEIAELAKEALALERSYGYPVNVEFALEGSSLRILQVRPVAGQVNVYRETRERLPLPESCS